MAQKERKKLPERVALDEFDKRHTGDLTKTQEEQRAKLDHALRVATFKDLAETRASRALRAIEGLSGLANARRYAFTPDQVKMLRDALTSAGSKCFARFDAALNAPKGGSGKAEKGAKLITL